MIIFSIALQFSIRCAVKVWNSRIALYIFIEDQPNSEMTGFNLAHFIFHLHFLACHEFRKRLPRTTSTTISSAETVETPNSRTGWKITVRTSRNALVPWNLLRLSLERRILVDSIFISKCIRERTTASTAVEPHRPIKLATRVRVSRRFRKRGRIMRRIDIKSDARFGKPFRRCNRHWITYNSDPSICDAIFRQA